MSDKEVVIVTGSSGRIGTRLIERLSKTMQCVALDFAGITSHVPSMEFIYVDLGSDDSVKQAFKRIATVYGKKIAAIVHLAAYYSFAGKHLELYEKITVQGTKRLLKEAQNFQVEQFIFTSTLLVHDPVARGELITEASPISGKWHYPQSKVRTEKMIHKMRGKIPSVILRIAGCYDDECNCVPLSQHIQRIYEKQLASFVFPGDVHNGVCYTHFDDLNDLLHLLIKKRKELPKELTLLAAEEESLSYRELQTKISRGLYGKTWPMIRIPKWLAKCGAWVQGLNPFGPEMFIKPWMVNLADDNYAISMLKVKEVLGWAPKHKLSQSLPKMIKNFNRNPIAWYQRHKIPLSRYMLKRSKKRGKK